MEQRIFDWFANEIDVSLTEEQWQSIQSFMKNETKNQLTHHELCNTKPANHIGDGYEGICDCGEIAKSLQEENTRLEKLEHFDPYLHDPVYISKSQSKSHQTERNEMEGDRRIFKAKEMQWESDEKGPFVWSATNGNKCYLVDYADKLEKELAEVKELNKRITKGTFEDGSMGILFTSDQIKDLKKYFSVLKEGE